MYCVYKHTCPNGKVYIGITKELPNERWNIGWGYKENKSFFKDILLYGWLNIQHEILAQGLTEEEAVKMETEQITLHKSTLAQYGYNQECGKGDFRNKETAQWSLDGTLICTYPSVKEAALAVGRSHPNITRAIARGGSCAGYLWSHSTESPPKLALRPRITTTQSGKPHPPTIPVAQYSKNGEFIASFPSIIEASKTTNINRSRISAACKGHYRNGTPVHTAGGYKWKFNK